MRGELRPGGTEREWCDPDVLRRLRRASLAALRKEVEPAEQAALGRFLPSWHGIDRRATLREALVPLQGLALPVVAVGVGGAAAPRARLPARASSTSSARRARSSGSAPGSTASRSTSARTRRVLGRPPAAPRAGGRGARRDPRGARPRAPSSGSTCSPATGLERRGRAARAVGSRLGGRGDERRLDAAARRPPLRSAAGRHAAGRAASRASARPGVTATQGRWSLADRLFAGAPDRARARRAPARAAGHRHARRRPRRGDPRRLRRGLRRAARARDARRLPPRLLRRGARRRAVRARPARSSGCASCGRARARSPSRSCSPRPIRRSRTAPRCRGRSARARARRASRARRSSCSAARPALFVERGGRSLVPLRDPEEAWLRAALAALVEHVAPGGAKRLAVERFDGEPVGETEVMPLLSRPASSPARAAPCCVRSDRLDADSQRRSYRRQHARRCGTVVRVSWSAGANACDRLGCLRTTRRSGPSASLTEDGESRGTTIAAHRTSSTGIAARSPGSAIATVRRSARVRAASDARRCDRDASGCMERPSRATAVRRAVRQYGLDCRRGAAHRSSAMPAAAGRGAAGARRRDRRVAATHAWSPVDAPTQASTGGHRASARASGREAVELHAAGTVARVRRGSSRCRPGSRSGDDARTRDRARTRSADARQTSLKTGWPRRLGWRTSSSDASRRASKNDLVTGGLRRYSRRTAPPARVDLVDRARVRAPARVRSTGPRRARSARRLARP